MDLNLADPTLQSYIESCRSRGMNEAQIQEQLMPYTQQLQQEKMRLSQELVRAYHGRYTLHDFMAMPIAQVKTIHKELLRVIEYNRNRSRLSMSSPTNLSEEAMKSANNASKSGMMNPTMGNAHENSNANSNIRSSVMNSSEIQNYDKMTAPSLMTGTGTATTTAPTANTTTTTTTATTPISISTPVSMSTLSSPTTTTATASSTSTSTSTSMTAGTDNGNTTNSLARNPIIVLQQLLQQYPQINQWLQSVNHLNVVLSSNTHAAQFLSSLMTSQPVFQGVIANIQTKLSTNSTPLSGLHSSVHMNSTANHSANVNSNSNSNSNPSGTIHVNANVNAIANASAMGNSRLLANATSNIGKRDGVENGNGKEVENNDNGNGNGNGNGNDNDNDDDDDDDEGDDDDDGENEEGGGNGNEDDDNDDDDDDDDDNEEEDNGDVGGNSEARKSGGRHVGSKKSGGKKKDTKKKGKKANAKPKSKPKSKSKSKSQSQSQSKSKSKSKTDSGLAIGAATTEMTTMTTMTTAMATAEQKTNEHKGRKKKAQTKGSSKKRTLTSMREEGATETNENGMDSSTTPRSKRKKKAVMTMPKAMESHMSTPSPSCSSDDVFVPGSYQSSPSKKGKRQTKSRNKNATSTKIATPKSQSKSLKSKPEPELEPEFELELGLGLGLGLEPESKSKSKSKTNTKTNAKTKFKSKAFSSHPSVIPFQYAIVTPKTETLSTLTRVRVKCTRNPLKTSLCQLGSKNFTMKELIDCINAQQLHASSKIDGNNSDHLWSMHHDITAMEGVYCLSTDDTQMALLDCQYNAFEYLDIHSMVETDSSESICHLCHKKGELLLCDSCPHAFHLQCVGLDQFPTTPKWFCRECTAIGEQGCLKYQVQQ